MFYEENANIQLSHPSNKELCENQAMKYKFLDDPEMQ
jgi:hypothetical protein